MSILKPKCLTLLRDGLLAEIDYHPDHGWCWWVWQWHRDGSRGLQIACGADCGTKREARDEADYAMVRLNYSDD